MKKLLSFFMSIVMLLSITTGLNLTANAEDNIVTGDCGNGYYELNLTTGVLTVNGYGKIRCFDYYAPGEKYRPLAWEEKYASSIKTVIINRNITVIENGSYPYSTKGAFANCPNLETVYIPNTVMEIQECAFSGSPIKNVYYDGTKAEWTKVKSYWFFKTVHCNDGDIQYAYQNSDYNYALNNDSTISIRKYKGTDKDVVIPSTINGNPVTSIYNGAFASSSVTSVVIPNTVTSIGNQAFYYCSSLTSVVIPNTVTSIGDQTFYNCSSLTSVTIPNNVKSIGYQAFYYCSNLANITIPNSVTSIGESAFYNTAYYNDKSNWDNEILYISNCLIATNDNKFTSDCTIKENTRLIADYAFRSSHSFESLTMPNSVTHIGRSAFNTYKISELYFNGSVKDWLNISFCDSDSCLTYKADNVYFNNVLITEITIPNGVKSIKDYAFYGFKNLKSVTIPNSVTSIGNCAFNSCDSLKSLTIPNSVTNVGDGVFAGCHNLTSITIGNSVTSIGKSVFSYCTSLASVTIPNSVTSIGDDAFRYCDNLTSVTIPNSVTDVGNGVFGYCDNLTSVTIGNGVTSIGNQAFDYCTSLTSLTIPDGVTSIGKSAFSGCTSLASITIGNSVTSIGESAFYNTAYYNDESNWDDGVLYISNCLIKADSNKLIGEYSVKENTQIIATSAFYSCTSLTGLTIPNSVTTIGNSSFSSCTSLSSVTIPNSVTAIGGSAFYSCTNLTSITIPDSVSSIGEGTFNNCKSLKKIVIPSSVKTISVLAFYISGLEEIYYGGSVDDWNNITVTDATRQYEHSNILIKAKKYYNYKPCTDTEHFNFGDWEIITPATCTNEGLKQRVCSEDGFIEKETILALGHDYQIVENVAPTCTEDGYITYQCSRCSDEYIQKIEPSHSYVQTVVDSTCTKQGYTIFKCSVCEDEYTDLYTEPLGHDFSGNAEYCKRGCGTRNPNYVPPTVTTEPATTTTKPATQPTNTTTVTEPQPTQAPTVVTTTNAQQLTTKAPVPTSSTTVAPTPTEPTTVTTTVAPTTTTQVEQTATAPNAVDTTQSTTKPATKTTKAKETVDKKQKKARVKKATPAKASLTITWAKVKGVKGYEIQLATDKKFKKNLKKVTIKKQKTTKTTVKKLKAKTKYYVHIRTYKTKKIKGKNTKVYSSWSKTKTVKTK